MILSSLVNQRIWDINYFGVWNSCYSFVFKSV